MDRHQSFSEDQRGFTLTEVLVAIAIFAIIFVAALLVYDRSNRVFQRSMEASDVQQNTRVGFEKLVADLRMAGFDFDRDGFPTGENKFQQPDEQLEFIDDHAITFRTNLDYETDAATDHGRETAYEPGFTTTADDTDDYFPIVTTANDEIVTYALVSDTGANDDEITFYADIAKPRATYPGGSNETLVTITGVDLCNDNAGCADPPYTLYRFTLDDTGAVVKTPLADNIRSLDFTYFSDALNLTTVAPNGGGGQYTVDATSVTTSAAANAQRSVRSSVQSIRMRLVGMSENRDANYDSPVEAALDSAMQVAEASQHRQFVLESNIVPRNLGRRGMEEPTTTPPGAPKVGQVCAEGCGVVRVEWSAPEYGSVDGYTIVYDTSATGSFADEVPAQANLFGYVSGLDPTETYYFHVIASNSYGSQRSLNPGGPIAPINYTKPLPPDMKTATGNPVTGTPAALENQITITWNVSKENVSGSKTSCGGDAETVGSLEEVKQASGFQIYRSTLETFDPSAPSTTANPWTKVFDDWVGTTDAPTVSANWSASWTDKTAKLNCTTYYYKIRQKERCLAAASQNSSGDIAQSYSDFTTDAIAGQSTANANPAAPTNVAITSTSVCGGTAGTGNCDVNLLWDRVTQDVNGSPIQVEEYVVKRVFAPGGVESPAMTETFTVTDPTPGAAGQMSWNNNTAADSTLVQPAEGDRYHYYVAARQCTSFTGAYSTPEAKFPCAVVAAGVPSPTPLDGDGETSPYLIPNGASSAAVTLTANKAIQSASMIVYVGNTSSVVTNSPTFVSHTAPNPSATFNVPLSNTTVYRAEMTMIDTTGCGTTIVRYFTSTFSNCCLVPLSQDSTVFSKNGVELAVTLKNQCTDPLTLNQFKVRWFSQNSAWRRLVSVTYPNGTVDNFGGIPKGTSGGGTISSNTTITVPAAVSKTIAAGGSYKLVLTFENSQGQASNVDFCGIYPNPDNNAVIDTCSIAQSAGICVF